MKKSLLIVLLAAMAAPLVRAQDPGTLLFKRVDLTIEQVTNLNSTPVEFLAAPDAGHFYAVLWSVCAHTGRFATAPGNLVLRAPGSPASIYLTYTNWSNSGCLLNATVNGNAGAYDRQAGIGRIDDGNDSWGGKGMEVFQKGGNPTVSETFPGSVVSIAIWYYLLPSYQANLPAAN